MGNKRMWNIAKEFEEKGMKEIAERISRDRNRDKEKLIQSGLPSIKEAIFDAEEFIAEEEKIKSIFLGHDEKKFFVATIPKEDVSGKLERKYTFNINSFQGALEFVKESLAKKNLKEYNVKINKIYDVDIVGILVLNGENAFFELVYGNNLDKLNHGEILPDLSGNYCKNKIIIENFKSLSNLKISSIELIKESLSILFEKGFQKGYFEIQHPLKDKYGKVVFINYIEKDSYQNIPFAAFEKESEKMNLKDLIKLKIKEITEEEIRLFVKGLIKEIS